MLFRFFCFFVAIHAGVHALSVAPAQSAELVLAHQSRLGERHLQIQALLSRVQGLIPQTMLKRLDRTGHKKIWIQLDQEPSETLSTHEMGYVDSSDTIHLRLPIPGEKLPGKHVSFEDYTSAALIHQISHLYENSLSRVSTPVAPSLDPQFEKLAGFRKNSTHTRNSVSVRSPDPVEQFSTSEFFAVNMEYYLLQPQEYALRRPSIHYFLNKHFRIQSDGSPHRVQHQNEFDLDPDRVYEIRYMYVTSGKGEGSSFGHSMLHLVVCKPDRALGPDCFKDMAYHRIIGFGAELYNEPINKWKGVAGAYPSRAFSYPFQWFLNYTQYQLRDIYSYPIRLNRDEKTFFVYQILERYWEYVGRYKFLNNNCVTEVRQILKASLDPNRIKDFNALTPYQLVEQLEERGYIDPRLIEDEAKRVIKGYYFPSVGPDLERAFSEVKNAVELTHPFKWGQTASYITSTRPTERKKLIRILENSPIRAADKIRKLRLLRLLESYIRERQTLSLEQDVINAVNSAGTSVLKDLKTRRDRITQSEFPVRLPQRGYGVPLPEDFSPELNEKRKKFKEAYEQDLKTRVYEPLKDATKLQTDQMDRNIDLLDDLIAEVGNSVSQQGIE